MPDLSLDNMLANPDIPVGEVNANRWQTAHIKFVLGVP